MPMRRNRGTSEALVDGAHIVHAGAHADAYEVHSGVTHQFPISTARESP